MLNPEKIELQDTAAISDALSDFDRQLSEFAPSSTTTLATKEVLTTQSAHAAVDMVQMKVSKDVINTPEIDDFAEKLNSFKTDFGSKTGASSIPPNKQNWLAPNQASRALDELSSSIEQVLSNLPDRESASLKWQNLVEHLRLLSTLREELDQIEARFDKTIHEIDSVRQDIASLLDETQEEEKEKLYSYQVRLQLAESLKTKLNAAFTAADEAP